MGLVCDDLERTRAELEARGVQFLTRGVAGIAGLRTTWLRDPHGLVFILMEKRADTGQPYYRQARVALERSRGAGRAPGRGDREA